MTNQTAVDKLLAINKASELMEYVLNCVQKAIEQKKHIGYMGMDIYVMAIPFYGL